MAEKTSTNKSNNTYSAKLKSRYQNFLQEAATLFPKVDQKLLLNILQFETVYSDWEGQRNAQNRLSRRHRFGH